MTGARTDYAIIAVIAGILLAVGVPALARGQVLMGSLFVALAILILGWAVVLVWRERYRR